MVINNFTNNNFLILSYLYDERNNENIIKTTQDEVAVALNLSRVTVNKAFSTFMQNRYIERDTKHIGRYVITNIGCKVIETIRTLNVESNIIVSNLID